MGRGSWRVQLRAGIGTLPIGADHPSATHLERRVRAVIVARVRCGLAAAGRASRRWSDLSTIFVGRVSDGCDAVTIETIVGLALLETSIMLELLRREEGSQLLDILHSSRRLTAMTPYPKRQTPITQRMAEDMLVRNLAPRTIDSYTYHVDRFARHFGKLPEDLGPEQIREFQLWLIQVNQSSWSQFNQAVCALRFLYTVTVPRPWVG